jgi:hypothetical protein
MPSLGRNFLPITLTVKPDPREATLIATAKKATKRASCVETSDILARSGGAYAEDCDSQRSSCLPLLAAPTHTTGKTGHWCHFSF